MKKRLVLACALVLMIFLVSCNTAPKGEVTENVTWEQLLAANKLEAIFEQVDSFSSTTLDYSDETYFNNVAMKDGNIIYSVGTAGYTEDYVNGIIYDAPTDAMEKSITIVAPGSDIRGLIDGLYGEELSTYQVKGDIYENEQEYFAQLYHEDKDWGVIIEGYAFFDKQTLLLDRVEICQSLGSIEIDLTASVTYNIGTDFAMESYDNVVNTDDAIDLTIHYPDGTTKDIKVDRDVTVIAYYPDHEQQWAACWNQECTARIDDLAWIEGNHGDIYLCQGDIPEAPPTLSKVLENSSFEKMFKTDYDSYFQGTYITDENDNTLQIIDLGWYVDEQAGLCLNFEIKDADYNVLQSGRARENAWYSWTEKDGYAIDFFDEFSYAEGLVDDYLYHIDNERLNVPLELGEEGYAYYLPYKETTEDGFIDDYRYWIHPDFDHIERIEITRMDENQNVVEKRTCYVGGNGPIPGDMDIYAAVAEPDDAQTIKLTVVSPIGEKKYTVRKDAKISWEGKAMYRDKDCTKAVTDLKWVSGEKATVYVK